MQSINVPYLNSLSQLSELRSLNQYAFDDTLYHHRLYQCISLSCTAVGNRQQTRSNERKAVSIYYFSSKNDLNSFEGLHSPIIIRNEPRPYEWIKAACNVFLCVIPSFLFKSQPVSLLMPNRCFVINFN